MNGIIADSLVKETDEHYAGIIENIGIKPNLELDTRMEEYDMNPIQVLGVRDFDSNFVGRNIKTEMRTLNCLYTNIRSIMNNDKRGELEIMLKEKDIQILGITESWGHEGIDDAELSFSGYVLFRRDRIIGNKTKGGGVLLYVNNRLTAVQELGSSNEDSESLWIKVLIGDASEVLYLGVCYRSPSASEDEIKDLFVNVTKYAKYKTSLIMGDFNYKDINWQDLEAEGGTQSEFLNMINDCFLTQHVKLPTRGKNILDLILTSDPTMVEEVEVTCPISNSDHNLLSWRINCGVEAVKHNVINFSYNRGNYEKISNFLNDFDWKEQFSIGTTEDNSITLRCKLEECRDYWVPVRKQSGRRFPAWMSKNISEKIKIRNRAWSKFNKNPTLNKQEIYKQKRNEIIRLIKVAKRKYELDLVSRIKRDPKSFYSYVRSKSKVRSLIGPLLDDGGVLKGDGKTMCEILNNYFSTVFTVEDLTSMPTIEYMKNRCDPDRHVEILEDIDITEKKVWKALKNMKENKSAGGDGFNSSYLLKINEAMVEPMTLLFKKSLLLGQVPNDWKSANITAIFKAGDKKKPCNYRPVSLTSNICKIMESIIKEEIVQHLERNALLASSQHGFCKQKSCLTNLLEYFQTVVKILDDGHPVDVVYLDFQKAFDKVPHERLLMKLEAHGVSGKVHSWIKDWLKGRKQRVVVDGQSSTWTEVTSGVPQGSVLGPILFIIYVNDLGDGLSCKTLKFADDTKMINRVGNDQEIEYFRADLCSIYLWSIKWQMPFNTDKCKVMHFGYNNRSITYKLGNKDLEVVKEQKDLGVQVSDNLKVRRQCSKAAGKGNRILGMIKRTFACRRRDIILPLYKSLVRPHLDYCKQVWSPYLRKDMDVLERVQRRATKLIEGYERLEYEERLRRAQLTTMETRAGRADMTEVFKILKGFDKVNHKDFFQIDDGRRRGHKLKLYKKRVRLNIAKYSFSNRICDRWNRLPEEVVESTSINIFKGRLDKYLGIVGGFK